MCTNGSRVARSTPAKARRTGKPSPSKPLGAVVTEITGRSASVSGFGRGTRASASGFSTVPAGLVAYSRRGTTISMTHTEVDPAFEGHGYGSVLARGALDAARAEGLAVLPFCPFIRSYIKRHPDYVDLVPADQRSRFELA